MTDQDDDRWEAEQQRDMDALEHAALKALIAARKRPLTDEEAMALAYSAGIANSYWKEIRQ